MGATRNLSNLSLDEALCLANFAKATPETLSQLADDPNPDVREAVGRHPSTPPNKLLELLEDANSWVSTAAQNNPNLPEELDVDFEGA